MKAHDFTQHNKRALECSNHRMVMVSSERVLVNPSYDNGSDEPANVKQYIHTYHCKGSCQQEVIQITINK